MINWLIILFINTNTITWHLSNSARISSPTRISLSNHQIRGGNLKKREIKKTVTTPTNASSTSNCYSYCHYYCRLHSTALPRLLPLALQLPLVLPLALLLPLELPLTLLLPLTATFHLSSTYFLRHHPLLDQGYPDLQVPEQIIIVQIFIFIHTDLMSLFCME